MWGVLASLQAPSTPSDRQDGEDDDDDEELADEDDESDALVESARGQARAYRVLSELSGLGAAAGAVIPFLAAMLGLLDGWALLAAPLGLGVLGWVVGSRFTRDRCSSCGGLVPRDTGRCGHCGAVLVASVRTREERLAAEDELRRSDPDAEPDQDPADDDAFTEPASLLMVAMYAGWAIRRDLITPEFAEQNADLVVRVRCGELPTETLSAVWLETPDLLVDSARAFIDDYFRGRNRPADEDYYRLTTGVAMTDSSACYQRVADVLDSRFEAWSRKEE